MRISDWSSDVCSSDLGVDHHPAQVAVDVHQRLRAQPVEKLVAIGREQHAAQVGVDLALVLLATLGDRQQRQIVVSQHADRIGAQRVHQAQRFQRLAAAVDQVAAEPQPVARRVEGDPVEKALRRFETTLQVANCPDAHATATVPCLNAGSAASTGRSEEHTSELQSLMRISYAVFCLKKKKHKKNVNHCLE